jgi:hypothetical protein
LRLRHRTDAYPAGIIADAALGLLTIMLVPLPLKLPSPEPISAQYVA